MNRIMVLVAVSLALISGTAQAKRCGPFGVFKSSTYCVSCPDGDKRVKNCPGGEVGRAAVGTQNQDCQVSYYDARYCRNASGASTLNLETEDQYDGFLSSGTAAVSIEGGVYNIIILKEDFEKLMNLEERQTNN